MARQRIVSGNNFRSSFHQTAIRDYVGGYGIGFVLCLFLWKKAYEVKGESYRWAFAATLSLAMLFGPHSMFYDFIMLGVGWAMTISPRILSGFFDEWKKTNLLENIWSLWILLYPGLTWLAAMGLKLNYLAQSGLHRIFLIFLCIIAISRFVQVAPKSAELHELLSPEASR
jgi:hypothetical protein